MSEQRIVIEINPDGSIRAKTDGFVGDICVTALQEILGRDELFSSFKPSDDFFQETRVETIDSVKARRD